MGTRRPALTAAAAAVLLLALAGAAPAGDAVRLPPGEAALDRDGDGFADVLVDGRTAYVDLDRDGRFDYSLTLAFKEYETAGHARYLAGGFSPVVYEELTRAGLDRLCASERVAADWTAVHFREFPYYHDGYGRLSLLDGSPGNDGRLAEKGASPAYEFVVAFNPDGTVQSVKRGDRTVQMATFDYQANVSSGRRLVLPRIGGPGDLERIRAELGRLF